MTKRTRGRPPSTLTGQPSVSPEHSPWWDGVRSSLGSYGIQAGTTYTIEELSQMIPSYPNGVRPRPRTVARRLLPAIELVERGPNGSLSKGAVYRVLEQSPLPSKAEGDEPIGIAEDFLNAAVERMVGRRQR